MRFALLIAALALGACESGGPLLLTPSGGAVDAPFGYVMYCAEYPSARECGGEK